MKNYTVYDEYEQRLIESDKKSDQFNKSKKSEIMIITDKLPDEKFDESAKLLTEKLNYNDKYDFSKFISATNSQLKEILIKMYRGLQNYCSHFINRVDLNDPVAEQDLFERIIEDLLDLSDDEILEDSEEMLRDIFGSTMTPQELRMGMLAVYDAYYGNSNIVIPDEVALMSEEERDALLNGFTILVHAIETEFAKQSSLDYQLERTDYHGDTNKDYQ